MNKALTFLQLAGIVGYGPPDKGRSDRGIMDTGYSGEDHGAASAPP